MSFLRTLLMFVFLFIGLVFINKNIAFASKNLDEYYKLIRLNKIDPHTICLAATEFDNLGHYNPKLIWSKNTKAAYWITLAKKGGMSCGVGTKLISISNDINYRFPSYKSRNEYYDLKSSYDPVSGYGPICNNIDNADCFGYYSKPKKYFYIGDFFLNKFSEGTLYFYNKVKVVGKFSKKGLNIHGISKIIYPSGEVFIVSKDEKTKEVKFKIFDRNGSPNEFNFKTKYCKRNKFYSKSCVSYKNYTNAFYIGDLKYSNRVQSDIPHGDGLFFKSNALLKVKFKDGNIKEKKDLTEYFAEINKGLIRKKSPQLSSVSDTSICYQATFKAMRSEIVQWNTYKIEYVKEAERRGLDCGVNKDITTASSQTKDPSKRPLASVSDTSVCYNATTNSGGNKVWNDRNDNFVGEAKYRGLDCGVNDINKTVIASKPKNIKPSISSAELEKERAKRLEEERKRKALEQRIAELEKKNKELQQPKKQQKAKPKSGSGSGFFISKLGHIITNQHVVNKCSRITIGDRIDKQVPAKLLETDKRNDLALIKTTSLKLASAETKSLIQKLSIEIVPLATGGLMRGNDVKLGEDVLVAGFPYGDIFSKNIKVTKGIVSSTTGIKDDSGQFQLDAAVQPGNSGGPIYDKYGNIVGVVVAQLNKFKMAKAIGSLPENVNFGIKASTVKQFLNESIPTRWSERTKEISTTKLSEIAKKQTVMVVCHR